MALEQEQIAIRKALEKEVASAWAQQPMHGRKEWDLSDPDTIKYDLPARVGDEDPRNGPASVQKFSGEDLHAGERKKLQMAQQKAWCVSLSAARLSARTLSHRAGGTRETIRHASLFAFAS
jgi:hypothetical protein